MTDKLSLFADEITYELLHPITNEPTGFILSLIGVEHDDVYSASVKVMKAMSRKGETEPVDFATSLDLKIQVAAACIVGWTNTSEEFKKVFDKLGFSDDSYSTEKALKLVSMKTAGWMRTQIDKAISERQRFFTSASNS
jgi:hypothetical protein